jgi:hypothetical protein
LFSCISSENNDEEEREDLALANATEKALQLRDNCNSIIKGGAKSGAEFFANRTYQGLNIPDENTTPQSFVIGRKGRAAGYEDENSKHWDLWQLALRCSVFFAFDCYEWEYQQCSMWEGKEKHRYWLFF